VGVRYHANDFDPTGSIRAMSPTRRRQYVLAGILVVLGVLTLAILWNVAETVFFAITVAYVLYPARRRLVEYGIPRRVASGLVTAATFLVVVVLLAPIAVTLFRRRGAIVALLNDLPEMLPVELFGFAFVIDIGSLVDTTAATLRSVAISLAADSVFIVLQFGVFVLLLYGLLLRPRAVGQVSLEIVPSEYHGTITALHRRTAGTLYAIYVIQAATAVLTFPIAFVVFGMLGYPDVFVLAVISAILQFIPILGPGILAVGLAGYDVLIGMPQRALGIVVLGPLLIGLLPDILVRPQLASSRAKLPASLYFVGFVGGVLTVGVIGVIAGPLVVALLIEIVNLLGEEGEGIPA
jgi:predicted PurR-regulated permease PerM